MPRTKEQFEEIRGKTRHSILESALELFAEKGFKGTSINDIAKATGVSKGLAYNYFKSKNDLMFAVFSLLEEKMGEAFFEMEKVEDPFKKLRTMINLMFKFLKEDEKFWQLYMNFTFQPEVQAIASEFLTEFLSGIFKELEKLFRRMGVKNPKEESKILAAIFDGIGFHYILEKDKYPLEKMRKFLIKKYSKEYLIQ